MVQPNWRIIETENHRLSIRSAKFLGEGWNSQAYLVNDELVFRFPKRPDQWEELQREIAFLAFAADLLPMKVPRYIAVLPQSPAAPCGYAAYRYLHGKQLDLCAMTQDERRQAAESIAVFLRTLHGLELNPELASALPKEAPLAVAEEFLKRTEREIAPKLPPRDARVVVTKFETYLSRPENFTFRPVVLHADFSRHHLLMDKNGVVAVLDFGDINWGDPDYDFHYLFTDFGQEFAEAVALKYGRSDTENLRSKLRYYAIADAVDTILYGGGFALDGEQEEAWQRLARLAQEVQ